MLPPEVKRESPHLAVQGEEWFKPRWRQGRTVRRGNTDFIRPKLLPETILFPGKSQVLYSRKLGTCCQHLGEVNCVFLKFWSVGKVLTNFLQVCQLHSCVFGTCRNSDFPRKTRPQVQLCVLSEVFMLSCLVRVKITRSTSPCDSKAQSKIK